MADAGLVDAAIVERLANDATLTALCPDGVYWDLQPASSPAPSAFVIVSHFKYDMTLGLGMTLYVKMLYWVVARVHDSSKAQARQAAARIDALLHAADLDLATAGYTAMHCLRIDRRADGDRDQHDKSAWQYHGALYEVMCYPT